jgi:hypothetical protein
MVLYGFWTEFCQIIHVQGNIILVFRNALVTGRLLVRAHLWTAAILLQPTSLSIDDLVGLLLSEAHSKLLSFLKGINIGSYRKDVSAE